MIRHVFSATTEAYEIDGEFFCYRNGKLERVVHSIGMAREVLA